MASELTQNAILKFQSIGQWLIVLFIVIASGLYLWQINEFDKESQRWKVERGQHLLEKTKANLGLLFSELRRDVVLLSQGKKSQIEQLVATPQDLDLYEELLEGIKDIIPEVFTATIADSAGKAIIEDFDGYIQQVCINDISSYASNRTFPDLYIHPNPFLYHFDLMTMIPVENKEYIFFVSFDASLISQTLENNTLPGYRMLLVNTEIEDLIEVTKHGSRNLLDGNNQLSEEAKLNIVGEVDIPNTRWKLLLINSDSKQIGFIKHSPESHIWPIIAFNIICILALLLLQLMKKRVRRQEILLQEKTNALGFSHEHLLAVFSGVLDGMITIDKDSNIIAFNPAAEDMFGYNAKEVMGKDIGMLIPEQFDKDHDDFIKTYLETGSAKVIGSTRKAIGMKKNGETFPAEISVNVVKYSDTIEFVGVVRDTSYRTQVEKMKNEFVSTISHEIRTPLTSIRGSLGLIAGGAMGEVSPKTRSLIEISLKNTERLIRLISEILDIDRIESGNMLFHFENISFNSVVTDSIKNIQGLADENNISIDYRCLCEDSDLHGDQDRLIQVVVNLLSNAIKFSEKDSLVLIVLDCDDEKCTLSIKDTGIGIPDEDHEAIFEKFSQVDSSNTRNIGGSGLGLSIVKSIITAHNGTIELVSQHGKGSNFIVKLPR